MKTIFILLGVIGVGKSTYAKELQEKFGAVVLSSDEIRKEFVKLGEIPKEYDSKYNEIVFGEMHKRIADFAKQGKNIVVDSTNATAASREPILNIAKEFGYKIQAELLTLDDEECLRRVVHRQNTDVNAHTFVNPAEALQIYKERLKNGMPTLEEGFHEINTYENGVLTDKKAKVLIASSNIGKIAIYAQILDKLSISYCSLRDLQTGINPEENGKNEIENAMIKAMAYHEATGLPVICNDSGLIIEKLSAEEQPGVFVRRFQGKELTDEQLIELYSQKIRDVGGESDAYFNVALAICDRNGEFKTKLFRSPRYMVEKPSKVICKGLPLRSLDYNKEYGKYMSEMTIEEANASEGKTIVEQAEFIEKTLK